MNPLLGRCIGRIATLTARTTLCSLLIAGASQAGTHRETRQWEKIPVPGAYCGDGAPYSLYFSSAPDPTSPNSSRALFVSLQGGGACWDAATCWGPTPLTWIHPLPLGEPPQGGVYSTETEKNPVAGYSQLYFPYCTGDVHLGAHEARYAGGALPVKHLGRLNVERGLETFLTRYPEYRTQTQSLVLYGPSAGAIGGLYHMVTLDRLLPQVPHKTLIADAPGLHFGKTFWNKFSARLKADYADALQVVGYEWNDENGKVISLLPALCARFPHWQISILQGSQDLVMSALFGEITPQAHEKLVFGPAGLWDLSLNEHDHCSAWIPRTPMHTFLSFEPSSEIRAGRMSAREFFRLSLESGGPLPSFRDY